MDEIERRAFMKGAAIGTLAFTVGGAEVMLTPRQARAEGAALRTLTADQAATLDAMGETLVPGAKDAGITYFVDQQISIPPQEALLEARIMNVKPPFPNFYRAALGAIDGASSARYGGRNFAQLAGNEQHEFVDLMRQTTAHFASGTSALFDEDLQPYMGIIAAQYFSYDPTTRMRTR